MTEIQLLNLYLELSNDIKNQWIERKISTDEKNELLRINSESYEIARNEVKR